MTSHEEFFGEKHLAAVLKHGVLKRYPIVFFSKTGYNHATGGRGLYFDAFAGPGRYEDGQVGSPIIASEMVREVAKFGRDVNCIFVEQDATYASSLVKALGDSAVADRCKVVNCDAAQSIDHVLECSTNIPLLSFIDPYGTGLNYQIFVEKLLKRRGGVPTEMLLNFNVEMVRRAGGQKADTNRKWLDNYLGGEWWQAHFSDYRKSDNDAAARADAVAEEYFNRIAKATSTGYLAVPISRKPLQKPIFWLTLFHESPHAEWKFLEAVSLAFEDYREEEYFQSSPEGVFEIFSHSKEDLKQQEDSLARSFIKTIEGNLLKLRSEHQQPISLLHESAAVYGKVLGQARDKHVNRAWDNLHQRGLFPARQKATKTYAQVIS